MVLSETAEEGLLTTDIGSIFFLNFGEGAAFKIISAHINCKIGSLECDMSNQNLISSGEDGGIRCWTLDSLDQSKVKKFETDANVVSGCMNVNMGDSLSSSIDDIKQRLDRVEKMVIHPKIDIKLSP